MRFLLGIAAGLACLAPMMIQAADRDGMIAERIARRLKDNDRLKGCDLSVSVSNGTARLKGTVKDQEQARIAVAAARAVGGVRQVSDGLGVAKQRVLRPPLQRRGPSPVKQAAYQISQEMPPQAESPPYEVPTQPMSPGPFGENHLDHRWSAAPSPYYGPQPGPGPRDGRGIPKHRLLHKIQWWPARPACPISRMTHLGSSWGYYPTCWRQWPPCAPSCPPPIPPEAYLPADMEETRGQSDRSTSPELLPAPEPPMPDDQPPAVKEHSKKGPA